MRWLERTGAVLLLLTAALAGCTTAPRSNSRSGYRLEAPPQLAGIHNDQETPEFTIAPAAGTPPDVAAKLATALAIALRDHGIVATPAGNRNLKRIEASVSTRDAGADLQIDIVWTVRDASGARIGGNEQRVAGKPQDWSEGNDRLVSRIAIQAAFRIARQLGRGDAANVPIAALPDVLGPGSLMPPPGAEGPPAPANLPAASTPAAEPAATTTPAAPAATPPPATTAASSAPRVFVSAVSGPGSRPMTSAMRRALGESQMVLTNRAEPGGYQVQGNVELSPPADGRQRIVIRWIVKRSDGTQIGDLEQANAVRAGSLDGSWDRLAPIVALAAVDGVVDLINRDRGGGGK